MWRCVAARNSTGCLSVSAVGLIASLCLVLICDIFTGSRSLLPPNQELRSTRRFSVTSINSSRMLTYGRSQPNNTFNFSSTTIDPSEEIRNFLSLQVYVTAQPEIHDPVKPTTKRHATRVGRCGDGIVDDDEDCDCGGRSNCSKQTSNCCNATTCTLVRGAECAGGLCCTRDCKLKKSYQLCRPAKNSCDLPEFCTGLTAGCRADAYKRNGDDCEAGQGYCFNRFCMTRNGQCEDAWGIHSISAKDECYTHFNPRGLFTGNCGLSPNNLTFTACSTDDVLCGKLQCKGGGQTPSTMVQSFAATIWANISGLIYQCKTIAPEVVNRANVQATLVRDGTKCDSDKMCLKGRCIHFRHLLPIGQCPTNNASRPCSSHGVCTDLNSCSCELGYSGPDCSIAEWNETLRTKLDYYRSSNMLNLRRGVDAHKQKTMNEVVDNDGVQIVVIIMSLFLLGATVAIMSLTCCRNAESYVLTDQGLSNNDNEISGSIV